MVEGSLKKSASAVEEELPKREDGLEVKSANLGQHSDGPVESIQNETQENACHG